MIDHSLILPIFSHTFTKEKFSDLLRYCLSYGNADLWIDSHNKNVFIVGTHFNYIKSIYEAKEMFYLFTFTSINASDCLSNQIPLKAFIILVENYLFSVDWNIEVDQRFLGDSYFRYYSGDDYE